eukprot:13018363-Alexandrium_andersonii.AAC.1
MCLLRKTWRAMFLNSRRAPNVSCAGLGPKPNMSQAACIGAAIAERSALSQDVLEQSSNHLREWRSQLAVATCGRRGCKFTVQRGGFGGVDAVVRQTWFAHF